MFLLHLERTLLNPLALHIVFGLLYSLIDFFVSNQGSNYIFIHMDPFFCVCLFTQYVKCFNNKHQNETYFKI